MEIRKNSSIFAATIDHLNNTLRRVDETTNPSIGHVVKHQIANQYCRLSLFDRDGKSQVPFKRYDFFVGQICVIGQDTNGDCQFANSVDELAVPVASIRRCYGVIDGKRSFSYEFRSLDKDGYVDEYGRKSGPQQCTTLSPSRYQNDKRYQFRLFTLAIELEEDFPEGQDPPDWHFEDYELVTRYERVRTAEDFFVVEIFKNGRLLQTCGSPDLSKLGVRVSYGTRRWYEKTDAPSGSISAYGAGQASSDRDAYLGWQEHPLLPYDTLAIRVSLRRSASKPCGVMQASRAKSREARYHTYQHALQVVERIAGSKSVAAVHHALRRPPSVIRGVPGPLTTQEAAIAAEVTSQQWTNVRCRWRRYGFDLFGSEYQRYFRVRHKLQIRNTAGATPGSCRIGDGIKRSVRQVPVSRRKKARKLVEPTNRCIPGFRGNDAIPERCAAKCTGGPDR